MAKRRDLIRMTDVEVEEFLDGRRTMNIATIGPDGHVHLVAMWYGFMNGHPVFETFAKSQKVLNLRRDPRITTLVEAGDTYETLRGVEIVGHAIIHDDHAVVTRAARSVVERYFGLTSDEELDAAAEMLASKRVAVEIVPERIVSWDHSKLGGGY